MAQRYEINEVVDKATSVQGVSGLVVARAIAAGLSIQVKDLAGSNLTVYQAETGSSTHTNPLSSDSAGRIEGWVEAPDFDLTVSGTGITTYTQRVRLSPPGYDVATGKQRYDRPGTGGNGWVQIGAGTGTLTDKSIMGTRIHLDSTTSSGSLTGEHINLNIVDGTPASSIHGTVTRVEINDDDGAVTGDTVALWGDVQVEQASGRPTWGLNTFVTVDAAGYVAAAVGAEIGVHNNATAVNTGAAVHLVSGGSQDIRMGLYISPANMENAILIDTTGGAPPTNALYMGPVDGNNAPTGTELFAIKPDGALRWNDVKLQRHAANLLGVETGKSFAIGGAADTSGNALRIYRRSNAVTGVSDTVILFVKDNGSGKMQLMAQGPTGGATALFTEP